MKKLMIDLASKWNSELHELFSTQQKDDAIEKIKESYPDVYEYLDMFIKRNEFDDIGDAVEFVGDMIKSGMNLNEIKETAKEYNEIKQKLTPDNIIKNLISNNKEDVVLNIFNLYNLTKDKIKKGQLYKKIKKDEELGFRRIKTDALKYVQDDDDRADIFDDIQKMFGIKTEILFIKLCYVISLCDLEKPDRDTIFNVYCNNFGYLFTVYLKNKESFEALSKGDLENVDIEFIKNEENITSAYVLYRTLVNLNKIISI